MATLEGLIDWMTLLRAIRLGLQGIRGYEDFAREIGMLVKTTAPSCGLAVRILRVEARSAMAIYAHPDDADVAAGPARPWASEGCAVHLVWSVTVRREVTSRSTRARCARCVARAPAGG